MPGPDPDGVEPDGNDHCRCAQVAICVAYVAPQGGDSMPTTKEAAPWYNQQDAQGTSKPK
jgi:hypothetical protein